MKEDGAGEEATSHDEPRARVTPGPPTPSAQERDSHECSGHSVYREWCDPCVRGRGRALQHRQHTHDGETVPVLSWDYGFLGSKHHGGAEDRQAYENGQSPVLCFRDRLSKSCFWYVVPLIGKSVYFFRLSEWLGKSGLCVFSSLKAL